MPKTLDEVEAREVRLQDVTEEGTLPGEKTKRGGAKKKLLMLAALGALLIITVASAYFLLGGKQVQVKANRKVPERVTNGADLQKAAYDALRGSLTGPVEAGAAVAPASNVGAGQPTTVAISGVAPSPAPLNANNGMPQDPTPAQPGIALTLAPPAELVGTKMAARERQPETNSAAALVERKLGDTPPPLSGARPKVGSSIMFAALHNTGLASAKEEAKSGDAVATASAPAGETRSGLGARELSTKKAQRASAQSAVPGFGAMLPVRSLGVLYTLRQGGLARFELVRDVKAENWALKRGTVFVGSVLGSDVERAYVQIKGFIDPATKAFTRLEGEALGSDGGAGLRGKRRRVSSAWVTVLERAAQSGTQILTGVLGRRDSSVIIASDPYGTYRSGVGYDQAQRQNNRTFVEVAAGTVGFVLVTTLPEPNQPDAQLASVEQLKAEFSADALPDAELAELLAEADPERIRAALPRMNPELRRVAAGVLAEIEAKKR